MASRICSSLLLPMAREVKNFDGTKAAFFAQRSQQKSRRSKRSLAFCSLKTY
jgi:hypothetical protein